jgi:hypothetical protein
MPIQRSLQMSLANRFDSAKIADSLLLRVSSIVVSSQISVPTFLTFIDIARRITAPDHFANFACNLFTILKQMLSVFDRHSHLMRYASLVGQGFPTGSARGPSCPLLLALATARNIFMFVSLCQLIWHRPRLPSPAAPNSFHTCRILQFYLRCRG